VVVAVVVKPVLQEPLEEQAEVVQVVEQHLTHLVIQQGLEQMELLILVAVAVEVLVELKLEEMVELEL
jgi:hypothetical protein